MEMKLICGFVRRFGHSCVRKIKPAKVCICGRNNCNNSLSRASNRQKFKHELFGFSLEVTIPNSRHEVKKILKYSASG